MTKVPQRFTWAASCLQLLPSHQVLELGCGAGLFVQEAVPYLDKGTITAIDQSAAMIAKARKRNDIAIKGGRAIILEVSLAGFSSRKKFDRVMGFNFNVFTKFPEKEMSVLQRLLKPGGELFIFYQAPYDLSRAYAEPIKESLSGFGFYTNNVRLKKLDHGNALLIQSSLRKKA